MARAAEAAEAAEAALVDKRGETGRSTDGWTSGGRSARRQAASVQHHVRANNRSTNRQTNTCNLQDGDADAADVMRSLASKAPPKRGRDAGHAAPNAALNAAAKRTKWSEYEVMNAYAWVDSPQGGHVCDWEVGSASCSWPACAAYVDVARESRESKAREYAKAEPRLVKALARDCDDLQRLNSSSPYVHEHELITRASTEVETSLNDLAALYKLHGRYVKAVEKYEEVELMFRRFFDEGHPLVRGSRGRRWQHVRRVRQSLAACRTAMA